MAEIDVSGSCEFASDWSVLWQGGAVSSLQALVLPHVATEAEGGSLSPPHFTTLRRLASLAVGFTWQAAGEEAGRPKTWRDIRRHRRWQWRSRRHWVAGLAGLERLDKI